MTVVFALPTTHMECYSESQTSTSTADSTYYCQGTVATQFALQNELHLNRSGNPICTGIRADKAACRSWFRVNVGADATPFLLRYLPQGARINAVGARMRRGKRQLQRLWIFPLSLLTACTTTTPPAMTHVLPPLGSSFLAGPGPYLFD